jgi:hypothetical protein
MPRSYGAEISWKLTTLFLKPGWPTRGKVMRYHNKFYLITSNPCLRSFCACHDGAKRWVGKEKGSKSKRGRQLVRDDEKKNRKSSSVFWPITPYSPLKANQRFGRTQRFCLQKEIFFLACFKLVSCFLSLQP